MKIILLIISFIIVIFTGFILYVGIYDELYQEIQKNKLWHSDGSFIRTLPFIALSLICLFYIFNYFKK